jgi:hypothetical protein
MEGGGETRLLFYMSRELNILKDVNSQALIVHKSQDVSPIIEANRIDRNEGPQDLSFGRKIASVPIDVLDAWIREGVDYRQIKKNPEMRKKFYEKLNSREWSAFKTYDGGIGC